MGYFKRETSTSDRGKNLFFVTRVLVEFATRSCLFFNGVLLQAAHEWKQKAGGLRIMAVLKFNARYRLGNSMERWRESIGGGYVSRAMHQAIIQEHATKVLELEVN